MYMEPKTMPAPRAVTTPRRAWPLWAWDVEARDNITAPPKSTSAPPSTPTQRSQPARCNSLKSKIPQTIPTRLLEFCRGKAMLRPMSRIAKMLNVFATAQRHPASTPQMIRWGTCRRSAPRSEVPRTNAGKLQRETKVPSTIMNEIMKGETAMFTNSVGASAAASHSPAERPHITPSAWSLRWRERSERLSEMREFKLSYLLATLLDQTQEKHPLGSGQRQKPGNSH